VSHQTEYKKYIDYIVNSGGSVSIKHFMEDWEPIAGGIYCELMEKGIIKSNDFNLWLVKP